MFILNGNTITLVYQGQVFTKQASDEEIAIATVHAQAQDYEELVNYLFPTPKNLLNKPGFWEQDGSIYYKNIKVSIPKVLADKFLVAEEEEFNRLIKFWGWLSLNPNPRTRENLYGWVEKNGIQLTNGGLMILYRRVIRLNEEDTTLGKFVKKSYEKLRKQKKSTNIDVYHDEDGFYYSVENYGDTFMGNLKQLYLELGKQTDVFTDAHTRKKKYMIGVEEREPRSAGDESDATCSQGIHAGGKGFGFDGFGDTPIAIVVNPSDVLNSVENQTKIRFCAMTPVAVLNSDCEWIDDPQVHERIDECYDAAIDRLETLLEQANFEDFKKHEVLSNEWNLAVGFETVLKILN